MNAPRVNNGKTPDEPCNASLLFWLPPNTPYGNFQLKLFKIIGRADELNRTLRAAYELWTLCRSAPMISPSLYDRHVFALEHCVFQMRRIADEMISLIHCLSAWESVRSYPDTIGIDCIGALLHQKQGTLAVFDPHRTVLEALNDVSNAYKHSFINTDHTLIGAKEPCIHALDMKRNKLAAGARFHNISCAGLVVEFDRLYADALVWLRQFSERHTP